MLVENGLHSSQMCPGHRQRLTERMSWRSQVIDFQDSGVDEPLGLGITFFFFFKTKSFSPFFFFAFYWWTYVISNWIYARMTIGQTHCGLFLFSPSGLWTRPVAGGSISNPRRGRDRKMTSILNCAVGEKRNEESRNPSWKETWQQYIYIYIARERERERERKKKEDSPSSPRLRFGWFVLPVTFSLKVEGAMLVPDGVAFLFPTPNQSTDQHLLLMTVDLKLESQNKVMGK